MPTFHVYLNIFNMAVSTYNNNECKYRIDRLDKVVYLISENASKNIHIDNGEAYITDVTENPLSLIAYNIELTDTDELDERYKFTHQLTFSVNGYANYKDFQGRYYAIVKSLDGEYWLVNPLFPNKVTFTYTLDGSGSHTDFTMSTASNHPTLLIHNMSEATPYDCGYRHCTFKSLRLNEKKNSLKIDNRVIYTNDGFKDVYFDKNSASFVEQFDGDNVHHNLTFNIKFDNYKSSWHYNLLEFADNIYAAIIDTSCDKHITCGFGFGLMPSFNVSADDGSTPNNIQIQLSDIHDNGDFIGYTDEITVVKDGTLQWVYTSKYNGYECVGNNLARYLLMEEVDALLNPTGRYKALVGYEAQFSYLNIVDTFTDTITFTNYDCTDTCRMQTSFPPEFVFENTTCRNYSVLCDSDWSITSSANHITVSPTSGQAGQSYTVTVCNTQTPSSAEVRSTLNVNYCNKTKTIYAKVKQGDGCLPSGSIFDISANGQYVVIPTICCVKDVDADAIITNISIQTTYIRVYVPENDSGNARQFTLTITYCDDSEGEVIINQSMAYERWVYEGTTCSGTQKCDVERKYTGTSATDINTWTTETRNVNCTQSDECGGVITRWIDTSETACSGGKRYIVQAELQSTDGGQTWTRTGNKRLGDETEDPSGECAEIYEYRWVITTQTICVGYDKYYLYKKQQRIIDSGDAWEDVVPTETSYDGDGTMQPQLIESDSPDCGYVQEIKWFATYADETTQSLECDETREIIIDEVPKSGLETLTVGDCVDIVAGCSFQSCSSLSSVTIGNSVTLIGYAAFEHCPNLTLLILGNSLEIIERGAFSRCGLTSVTIPNSVTDIGYGAFLDCYSLASLTLGNVETIGDWAFTGCRSLTSVIIPDSVTTLGDHAFYGCSSLTSASIGSGVTTIEDNVFGNCTSLSSVAIPNTITSIGRYAFGWCRALTSVTIPNSVTTIGEAAFHMCDSMTSVTIGNSVTSIGDLAFGQCDSLTSVTIPSSVTSIGDTAFAWCDSMASITCLATTPPTLGTSAFANVNNFPLYVPCESENAYKTAWNNYADRIRCVQPVPTYKLYATYSDSTTYQVDCNSSSELTTGETRGHSTSYTAMTTAVLGNCITSIGDEAFDYCSGLTSVTIPNSVTSIGDSAFSGCRSLSSITIPNSVTSIGDTAFNDCRSLSSVTIPNGVTTIGLSAFNDCRSLSSVTIGDSVTTIGVSAFQNCSGLTSVTIPSSVTSIKTSAFYACSSLTSFTCLATTPPTLGRGVFDGTFSSFPIYVPSQSVSAYKSASGWSTYASRIFPIE